MKRVAGLAALSCAFASCMLLSAGPLGQNAVAEPNGAAWNATVQRSGVGAYDLPADAENKARAACEEHPGSSPDVHSGMANDVSLYPTAAQCGECHKQIYEEWSSSQHAYASISPMFHKFEQSFQDLTQGTVGTFCVRCHQQSALRSAKPATRRSGSAARFPARA